MFCISALHSFYRIPFVTVRLFSILFMTLSIHSGRTYTIPVCSTIYGDAVPFVSTYWVTVVEHYRGLAHSFTFFRIIPVLPLITLPTNSSITGWYSIPTPGGTCSPFLGFWDWTLAYELPSMHLGNLPLGRWLPIPLRLLPACSI